MLLGTAILDLARYAMKGKTQDRLPLTMTDGNSESSYIEVIIKASPPQEETPSTPSFTNDTKITIDFDPQDELNKV